MVMASMLPMMIMGDFNKAALSDPQLSKMLDEWGYRVWPLR